MATRHLPLGGHPIGTFATLRADRWWVGPAITVAVFLSFIVYATFRVFEGTHYFWGSYLSPFFSPLLFSAPVHPVTGELIAGAAPLEHAWFGAWPAWMHGFIPVSPAALILVFPGAFRFTCYYYRKAYYRSFAQSPPGCAVVGRDTASGSRGYRGETFLLLFQNLHRYALYPAVAYIFILGYDAVLGFTWVDEMTGETVLRAGVGSFVLILNAILLGSYTFGCHSFRHLIGGHDDCMSCGHNTLKHTAWKQASWFNARHMQFAWVSLFWVAFTDVYVTLVSRGTVTDLELFRIAL